MSDIVDQMINLGQRLADERNAAHDLWTWLPSYKATQKHHGDYASNFAACPRDVMVEASMYLAFLRDFVVARRSFTPDEAEMFESCVCGEEHE